MYLNLRMSVFDDAIQLIVLRPFNCAAYFCNNIELYKYDMFVNRSSLEDLFHKPLIRVANETLIY